MEFRICVPGLLMLLSVLHAELPAAPGEGSARRSRAKRCSCATFLDKECVYFCHLDIIWVNTPERTVSYGLGRAPRQKRAAREVSRAAEFPRCECADSTDGTCAVFCRAGSQFRHKVAGDRVTTSGRDGAGQQRRPELAAETSGVTGARKGAEPSIARATRELRLLLKDLRLSRSTRAWAAENAVS